MRSSLARFQKRAMAVVSYMQKAENFTTTQIHEFFDKSEKQLAKLAGGGRISGKTMKIHGAKECQRRVRQMSRAYPNITTNQTMAHHLAKKLIGDK